MRHLMSQFWNDDEGALIATEWVFVVTILVIGLVAGLKSVQQAVLNELEEVAGAIGALSQSYSFGGTHGCCRFTGTSGSRFVDSTNDFPVSTCTEAVDEKGASCPD
jgi:Flp pilus assembly pilin Flp